MSLSRDSWFAAYSDQTLASLDGFNAILELERKCSSRQSSAIVVTRRWAIISASTLRLACAIARIDAVQMEYSPFSLEIAENGLLSACRELGIAVAAYAPLGKGFLTGAVRSPSQFPEGDMRRLLPRFGGQNFPKNLEVVDKLVTIADCKGCTPSQLTLAWLAAGDPLILPIPGTTKVANCDENMGALNIEITEDDDRGIREAISSAEIIGSRYPEVFMDACFVDIVELDAYQGPRKM